MEMQWKLFVCFGFFSLCRTGVGFVSFFSSVFSFLFIFIFCRNRNGWKCIVFISHRQFMANPLSVCSAMAMMCFETIWALNKYNIMWVRFFLFFFFFSFCLLFRGAFFFTFCYWSFRTSGINNTDMLYRKKMHAHKFQSFLCWMCAISHKFCQRKAYESSVCVAGMRERRRRENKRNACPCPYIWCFISLSLAL